MQDHDTTRRIIESALRETRYAVLATEAGGQPHASLMAFAVQDHGRGLVFATYRETRKHANLCTNPRVAVFIDHHEATGVGEGRRQAVTATGHALEVPSSRRAEIESIYLDRHPELADFVAASGCALVRVAVDEYQVAGGIDDVGHCRAADLGLPADPA